ncbi:MAG: hypothetical protein PHT54_01535 [Candidatus Nanoarchaeia archaeon]|nr:hypothetical protein [Candidatus Nanoarchaeia archaeon]
MNCKFGTSGIRGPYPESINEEVLFRLGVVLSREFNLVYVGMDIRDSSESLLNSLIKGLLTNKIEVINLGLAPVGALASLSKNSLGVYITASHNPFDHNGFKIFYKGGEVYGDLEKQIENNLNSIIPPESKTLGILKTMDWKWAYKKSLPFLGMGSAKIVLACNGSAKVVLPTLLSELGYELICLNEEIPIEQYDRKIISKKIRETNSDICFLLDADGDRLIVFDENGEEIQKDIQLNLALDFLKPAKPVLTVESSHSSTKIMSDRIITAVGSKNVGSIMMQLNSSFGGEPAGEFIYSSLSYCPDGIATALLFLEILKQGKISNLRKKYEIPKIYREKYLVLDRDRSMEIIKKSIIPYFNNVSLIDGVRIEQSDGFALIRPSGTESLIRLTYENFNDIETVKKIIEESI